MLLARDRALLRKDLPTRRDRVEAIWQCVARPANGRGTLQVATGDRDSL